MAETAEQKEAPEVTSERAEWLTTILAVALMSLLSRWELMLDAEAMLVGFSVAYAVSYWLPPRPAEGYGRWTLWRILVIVGVYLAFYKIPPLLKPRLPFVLAYALPLLALFAAFYLARRRWAKKPSN